MIFKGAFCSSGEEIQTQNFSNYIINEAITQTVSIVNKQAATIMKCVSLIILFVSANEGISLQTAPLRTDMNNAKKKKKKSKKILRPFII